MSNSTNAGMGLLEHAREPLERLLTESPRLVFVPFALKDWDAYTESARTALRGTCDVRGIHTLSPLEAMEADAFYVGGGNTFRLLRELQDRGLVEILRRRVAEGALYVGASAGSVIASPNIRTTNDMPIVQPQSFVALGFLGFQLNCHYPDEPSGPRVFMGETRDERLYEFLEENRSQVVCLREGAWLEIDGSVATLGGTNGGRLFEAGREVRHLEVGEASTELGYWRSPVGSGLRT